MTGFVVTIAPRAEGDIHDAFSWYRERSLSAAEAFRSAVFEAIDGIAASPLSRAIDDAGNRKRSLKRFPYSIFDDVAGKTVVILAVAHHRRRPGYWRAVD